MLGVSTVTETLDPEDSGRVEPVAVSSFLGSATVTDGEDVGTAGDLPVGGISG